MKSASVRSAALVLSVFGWLAAPAFATEIYVGEPLGEALHDLRQSASPVSHEISSASNLEQTNVFRLSDGRMLAMTSRAKKAGGPHTVWELRVTPSLGGGLSMQLSTVATVKLPE